MEKKYITPKIKVRELDYESALLVNSLDKDNPTGGLPGGDDPRSGGTSTGGEHGDAGSKYNIWNNWGIDDEE